MSTWVEVMLACMMAMYVGAVLVGMLAVLLRRLRPAATWHRAAARAPAPDVADATPVHRPAGATPPAPAARAAAPPVAPHNRDASDTPADEVRRIREIAPKVVGHIGRWAAALESTAPIDRQRLERAVRALYATVGLKAPRIVVVPSPLSMMLAYGLAAAITRLRQRPAAQPGADGPQGGGEPRVLHKVMSWLIDDPARLKIECLRGAVMTASQQRWMLAQRLVPYPMIRPEEQGILGLEQEMANALEESIRLVRYGDPVTGKRWTEGPHAALAAAGQGAMQAIGSQATPELEIRSLEGMTAWLCCCTGADLDRVEALMDAGLFDSDLRLRHWWMPLHRDLPIIGASRYFLNTPDHDLMRFGALEDCALEAGDLLAHTDFCIVSERPELTVRDERGLLHSAEGPSVRWRDGWSLYHWHGTRLPWDRKDVITHPGELTPDRIDREGHRMVRRVMLERYGLARFVLDSGPTVVQAMPLDHPVKGLRGARLLSKQVGGDEETLVFVELVNSTPEPDGTLRRYMLRVDPGAYQGLAARDCHAAAASTWRRADGGLAYERHTDYQPASES
jgi:hypothetical protein